MMRVPVASATACDSCLGFCCPEKSRDFYKGAHPIIGGPTLHRNLWELQKEYVIPNRVDLVTQIRNGRSLISQTNPQRCFCEGSVQSFHIAELA